MNDTKPTLTEAISNAEFSLHQYGYVGRDKFMAVKRAIAALKAENAELKSQVKGTKLAYDIAKMKTDGPRYPYTEAT